MNEALKAALAKAPPQITIRQSGANVTVIRHSSSPGGGGLTLHLQPLYRFFGLDLDPVNYRDNVLNKKLERIYADLWKQFGEEPGAMSSELSRIDGVLGKRQLSGPEKLNYFYNYFKVKASAADAQREVESYHAPIESTQPMPQPTQSIPQSTQPYEVGHPPTGAVQ